MRNHGRHASERREPLSRSGLALKAGDRLREAVEGSGEYGGVRVNPPSPKLDFARQVAGRRHLAHGLGDGEKRPRYRPRHAVAEHDRKKDAEERRERQPFSERGEKRKTFLPRTQERRDRTVFNEWHFRRDVIFGLDELLGHGRSDHTLIRAQHDLALRELAELERELGVQEEAEAQDAQLLGRFEANRDGHRHDLKEARGGTLKGCAFVPGGGVRSERGEHAPVAVADHHDVRTNSLSVLGSNGQDGRRVAGGDGRLQLGQIGDQPSHACEGFRAGRRGDHSKARRPARDRGEGRLRPRKRPARCPLCQPR